MPDILLAMVLPPRPAILACVVCVSAGSAVSAPSIDDFERAWKAAQAYKLPRGTEVAWRETTHATMTPAEVDAAIAQLGSEPRENERALLEGERWLANMGPSTSTYRLWYLGDDQFRLNEDIPNAEWSPQIDAAVNRDEGWIYASEGSVSVMDLDRPPPGRNPRIHVQKVRGLVQELIASGMGFGSPRLEVRTFDIEGDEWRAMLSLPDTDVRFRLTGYYRADPDQFVVRTGQFLAPGIPETDGQAVEFSGHRFDDALDREVAQRFVHRDAQGRTVRVSELDTLARFDPSGFGRIAAVPAPGGADPTRADRVIKRIDDYRPATAVTRTVNAAGQVVSTEPLATAVNRRGSDAWRWAGWLILPVLVGAFVLARMKRSG